MKNTHGLLVIVEQCGIHCVQTFCLLELLVRIRLTLAREVLTSVTIAVHEILCVRSRTDSTYSMWQSSVADIGAPLQESLSVCSQPFLTAFTHRRTASYEGVCVPKLSLEDR